MRILCQNLHETSSQSHRMIICGHHVCANIRDATMDQRRGLAFGYSPPGGICLHLSICCKTNPWSSSKSIPDQIPHRKCQSLIRFSNAWFPYLNTTHCEHFDSSGAVTLSCYQCIIPASQVRDCQHHENGYTNPYRMIMTSQEDNECEMAACEVR